MLKYTSINDLGDILGFIDFLHGTKFRASSIKNLAYCYVGLAQPLTAGWSSFSYSLPLRA